MPNITNDLSYKVVIFKVYRQYFNDPASLIATVASTGYDDNYQLLSAVTYTYIVNKVVDGIESGYTERKYIEYWSGIPIRPSCSYKARTKASLQRSISYKASTKQSTQKSLAYIPIIKANEHIVGLYDIDVSGWRFKLHAGTIICDEHVCYNIKMTIKLNQLPTAVWKVIYKNNPDLLNHFVIDQRIRIYLNNRKVFAGIITKVENEQVSKTLTVYAEHIESILKRKRSDEAQYTHAEDYQIVRDLMGYGLLYKEPLYYNEYILKKYVFSNFVIKPESKLVSLNSVARAAGVDMKFVESEAYSYVATRGATYITF